MSNIETLITDIYSLFESDITSFPINIQHENRSGEPVLRMSNLGRPLRQLYYELNKMPSEGFSGQVKFKFGYGNLLEDVILALAEKAGHTVTNRQLEVHAGGIAGHIDAIIDGCLVDVKSCSPASYTKFISGELFNDDPFAYVTQLSSYLACLPTVYRAFFLSINKVSGALYLLEIPNKYKTTKTQVEQRISEVREAVSKPVEPDFCYQPVPISKTDKSGNLKLPVGCSYCSFKFYCHRDSNNGEGLQTFNYANGPVYMTTVKKLPRVDRIEEFKVKNV